jgi:hypothetical protein
MRDNKSNRRPCLTGGVEMKKVYLILNDENVCYKVFATEEAAQRFLNREEAKMGLLKEVFPSRIEECVVEE